MNWSELLVAARALEPKPVWGYGPMTLLDVARAGSLSMLPVIEALSQRNQFLQDAVWVEGGQETGHRVTMWSRYPEVSIGRIR